MNLAEIMTTNFAVVTPQATLADASRRMVDVDTGCIQATHAGASAVRVYVRSCGVPIRAMAA